MEALTIILSVALGVAVAVILTQRGRILDLREGYTDSQVYARELRMKNMQLESQVRTLEMYNGITEENKPFSERCGDGSLKRMSRKQAEDTLKRDNQRVRSSAPSQMTACPPSDTSDNLLNPLNPLSPLNPAYTTTETTSTHCTTHSSTDTGTYSSSDTSNSSGSCDSGGSSFGGMD